MAWATGIRYRRGFGVLAFAAALAASSLPGRADPADAKEGGPFSSFAGSWTGSGTIQRASGETERLRCQVNYQVTDGGNALQQSMQCSSDSYNFDLRCTVEYQGGSVSGTWLETTRNTEGKIVGQGQTGIIKAAAQGAQFSASIFIQTKGRTQTVSIRSPGTELTNVSITLNRKG